MYIINAASPVRVLQENYSEAIAGAMYGMHYAREDLVFSMNRIATSR